MDNGSEIRNDLPVVVIDTQRWDGRIIPLSGIAIQIVGHVSPPHLNR